MGEHETFEGDSPSARSEVPTPANFAEAKALQRFQQGQEFAAQSSALSENLRSQQAAREADARAQLEEAKADPNIISEIPKFDTPEADN